MPKALLQLVEGVPQAQPAPAKDLLTKSRLNSLFWRKFLMVQNDKESCFE